MEENRRGCRAMRPTFSNRVRERMLASRPAVVITGVISALALIIGGGYTAATHVMPQPEAAVALTDRPAEHVSRQVQRTGLEGVERVTISVTIDGQSESYTVPALSLAEALADAGIVVGPFDEVSMALSTQARDGLELSITRKASGTLTEEEVTEFATIEEPDPTLLAGERVVVNEGQEGITRIAYSVYTVAGEETARDELAIVVVQEAEDRVVRVGTRPPRSGEHPIAGPVPVDNFPPVSPGSAQEIAQNMIGDYGWDDNQFSCLRTLWHRESGWNYRATNPSTGAYGIPQALPGSKMASAGADWRTNPATQIKWGLRYIQGRYGSPCGALNFFHAHNWY